MGKLSGFKYREIVKKLSFAGFSFFREAKGSHEIWYNKNTGKYTTVVRRSGDISEGTLKNILKQADIEVDDFLDL